MTSEEIKAAVERLNALDCDSMLSVFDVARAFMDSEKFGSYDTPRFRNRLIGLLEQADLDTHMELPVDADGVHIHIGDEVCGYNHPNGGVYCHAIVNPCVIAVGDMADYGNSNGWQLWNTLDVRHYRKPTVEDVLTDMANEVYDDAGNAVRDRDAIVARYTAKLREVMREVTRNDQ